MKNTKLKIESLKVKSFLTKLEDKQELKTVKGGMTCPIICLGVELPD